MWVKRLITGLGVGAFVFLLLLLVQGGQFVTPKVIIYVFVISALVGISTVVFEIDKLSYFRALCLHYVMVAIIVTGLDTLFFGIDNIWRLLLGITEVYIVAYVVTLIQMKVTARQLNKTLEQIQQDIKK